MTNLLKHSLRSKGKKIYVPQDFSPNLEELTRQISEIKQQDLPVQDSQTHSKDVPLRQPSVSMSHSSQRKSDIDSQQVNFLNYSITEQFFEQTGQMLNIRRHSLRSKISNEDMRSKLRKTSCKKIWLPKVLNVDPFIDELTRRFNHRVKQFESSKKSQYQFLDPQLELNSFFARQIETKSKQLSKENFLQSSTFRGINDETGIRSMQNQGPQTQVRPNNISRISSQNLAYLYYQHKDLLSFLKEPPIASYYENAESVLPIELVILNKRYLQKFRNLYEDVKHKSKRHIRASIFSQPNSPSPRSMDRQTSSQIVVEKILKVPIGSKGVWVNHGPRSIASQFEYDVMLDINSQMNLISFYIPVNRNPQLRRKAIAPQNNSILEQPESLYSTDSQGTEFSESQYSRADSMELLYYQKRMLSHQHIPQLPYLARIKDNKVLRSMENKKEIIDSPSRKQPDAFQINEPINLHVNSISTESWSALHRNHPSDQREHQFLAVDYENATMLNIPLNKSASLFYRSQT